MLRVVLSKNPDLVIIFPEINLRIIWNQQVTYCHAESNRHRKISNDLAQHYGISAIVQVAHVPCKKYHNMSSLSPQQRQDIAELYLKKKEGKLDPHPSEYVHKMMAEFLLHYFLISTSETSYRTSKKEIDENEKPFKMPAPLYRGTVLLEKSHEFHCIAFAISNDTITVINNKLYTFDNLNFPSPAICRGNIFRIVVFVNLKLCAHCHSDQSTLQMKFTFKMLDRTTQEIGPIDFTLPLPHNGYRTTIMQRVEESSLESDQKLSLIIPGNSSLLKFSFQLDQEASSNYEIDIRYFAIGFQCID